MAASAAEPVDHPRASAQRTHLHLLVEAKDKEALAAGMQGFQISAAKHLNAAISKGKPGLRAKAAALG
jgi:hypothetical protein